MKTGHFVWLEVASIFLSLVFEKTLQMSKTLVKMIGFRYVSYHICRRNYIQVLKVDRRLITLFKPFFRGKEI